MRTRIGLVLIVVPIGFVLAGLISGQPPAPHGADSPMSWPEPGIAGWPTSTPAAEGFDPEAIDALIADIDEGEYGLVDHLLIIRHGRVVVDRHFEHDYEAIGAQYDRTNHQYNYDHPDWHPYYRDTALHTLQSVTKSITSAALGIAIDEGLIPEGVKTPAMSFFAAYEPDLTDPRKRAMTLEDMLTMRSGFDWNEMISYDDETNSCNQLEASEEWIRFVLDRPMREAPGTRFDYNSGVSVLLGKIVGVATGRRIDAWAEEKLFKPIGITEYYWKVTPDGEIDTEGGLYLAAHDLARIAYLFLRNGRWKDRQVISEQWIRSSTAPVVPDIRPDNDRANEGYGYQWWIPHHKDGETVVYMGSGYGGQFPIVVPAQDLIVVFNAWNIHDRPPNSTQQAMQDRILPAIKD